jgi:uncharacterized protein (TIGR02145 family)
LFLKKSQKKQRKNHFFVKIIVYYQYVWFLSQKEFFMKLNRSVMLAASVSFAMAFMFSCSSDEDSNGGVSFGSLEYEGQQYKTLQIGNKVWMAENLNYNARSGRSRCYDNNPDNCAIYGRLYDYATAMTVCPEGWHLSTNDDWDEMFRFLEGSMGEAAIRTYIYTHFVTQFGGFGNPDGTFSFSFSAVGNESHWWNTCVAADAGEECYGHFGIPSSQASNYESREFDKTFLLSVRCVQGYANNVPPPVNYSSSSLWPQVQSSSSLTQSSSNSSSSRSGPIKVTNGSWTIYTDYDDTGTSAINSNSITSAYSIPNTTVNFNYTLGGNLIDAGGNEFDAYVGISLSEYQSLLACKTGITYNYQGAAHNFMVRQSNVEDFDYHLKAVSVSSSWATAEILFSELNQSGFGKRVAFNEASIEAINWQVNGINRTGSLAIKDIGCIGGSSLSSSSSLGSNNNSFTDLRDGKTYNTVKIGTQTWMAENLNYAVSGVCYNNQNSNCAIYGRLYNWATAMDLPASCNTNTCASQINTPNHKGLCPEGWHIPKSSEFSEMARSLVDSMGETAALAYIYANLVTQFGGYGNYYDDSFSEVGYSNNWWNWDNAAGYSEYGNSRIFSQPSNQSDFYPDKNFLLSVRCIRN